jgi:cytochrome P450
VNSNTIPITAWAMMELIRDPSLFQAIRAEVLGVTIVDPTTGKSEFDIEEILALPLLQSVYIECLRMRVSINVTRELAEPMVLNGFKLRKDGLLQAPTEISHYEETVWAKDGHPASEFWAERHVKIVKEVDSEGRVSTKRELSMAGRSNDFFPFGVPYF